MFTPSRRDVMVSAGMAAALGMTSRLVIDPAADNAAAIASYSKVGFRPVGIMRRYERGSDGSWHDGLLMDLIAEELLG